MLCVPLCARAELVTTSESLAYLRVWEGVSTTPYRDNGGYSVGVGHWLGRTKPAKTRYTQVEILNLFYRDLAIALEACQKGVKGFADLPKDVQLVTLGLAWSVGPSGFQRFTNFRRALSRRAYNAASIELADSKWWGQVEAARARHSFNVLQAQP